MVKTLVSVKIFDINDNFELRFSFDNDISHQIKFPSGMSREEVVNRLDQFVDRIHNDQNLDDEPRRD